MQVRAKKKDTANRAVELRREERATEFPFPCQSARFTERHSTIQPCPNRRARRSTPGTLIAEIAKEYRRGREEKPGLTLDLWRLHFAAFRVKGFFYGFGSAVGFATIG